MVDLGRHGLRNPGQVYAGLAPAVLVEMALRRGEGLLADNGALVAYTGPHTGRSPRDRFFVADPAYQDQIAWSPTNQPIEPKIFSCLHDKMLAYLQGRDVFVFDGWACADPTYSLAVRVITEKAWHALFSQCLLLRQPPHRLSAVGHRPSADSRQPTADSRQPTTERRQPIADSRQPTADSRQPNADFQPQLTILHAADMHADPAKDGTRSDIFILLNLSQNLVLIGGTHYAGEIKKSVFTYLNYLLPQRGVLPMHCSATVGAAGDTALLFGLSGTGKTTLSADPQRHLIGDDEHGWSDEGIFNFEGGCYAKTIRLSPQGEPQIWNALRFGAVLENVVLDPQTRKPDYDSQQITENTRAAYPVEFIDGAALSGRGGHPKNGFFLTCDAFGVLPPVSRLTQEQALYHFLSGYTAKVAGTEAGVSEPQATFSTCFGAPFLPLPPVRYANMLQERLRQHGSQVWLINTGWTGGPFGKGRRVPLAYTRQMVNAVLDGSLAKVHCTPDPIFGVLVPETCSGVPAEILHPRQTWANPDEYDQRARHLAQLFGEHFRAYASQVADNVRQAGPKG